MATQTPPKTGFQKWQDDIDKAEGDPRWDAWDCEIQLAVNEYNRHLAGTAEYLPLDWQFIKAILWVESGPHKTDWDARPMQIGMMGDPGAEALLGDKEGGDLIMPPTLQRQLTLAKIRTLPTDNIRAGIGYLLMRMAHYEDRSVLDSDDQIHEVTVKPGDNFEKIARKQGSTIDILEKLNPDVDTSRLQPKQVLKYQKASVQRVIKGWRVISSESIMSRYNSGRTDPMYAKKIDYALSAIRKKGNLVCAN